MQTKFLKDIVEEITGKQAGEIVDILAGKKDVNEFLIAKKLNLTINQTRNILYKLSDFGMISFIRKKDKRKGWYIYFWTLSTPKSLEILEKKIKEEITQLENKLKSRKTKRFYSCKTCETEIAEESALLHNYTCSECGEIYEVLNNTKIIKQLENKTAKLKRELKLINEEKNKEIEKEKKKKPKTPSKKTKKSAKKKKKTIKKGKKRKIKKSASKKSKKPAKKKAKKKPKKKSKKTKKRKK